MTCEQCGCEIEGKLQFIFEGEKRVICCSSGCLHDYVKESTSLDDNNDNIELLI